MLSTNCYSRREELCGATNSAAPSRGAEPNRATFLVALLRRILREEDGRILLLGLGATVLLLTLILLSLSVTGIYLEQRRLVRLADQTAAMAAAAVSETQYYRFGLQEHQRLEVDTAGVTARVKKYLTVLCQQDALGTGATAQGESSVTGGALKGLHQLQVIEIQTTPTEVSVTLAAQGEVPFSLPLVSTLKNVELQATGKSALKASLG